MKRPFATPDPPSPAPDSASARTTGPAPEPAGRSPRRASVLGNRDLRLIIAGRTVSFAGDQIAVVAILMYAYTAGWGTTGVSLVMVAATVPMALGAPLAGLIADRCSSRLLTIGASLWEAGCVLGLAAVTRLDKHSAATMAGVLILLFALAMGQAVSGPAWTALVPTVCAREQVPAAVGAVQAATTLSAVLGPALGGVVVAAGGTGSALLTDAATFIALFAAAILIRGVRRPEPATATTSGVWSGIRVIRDDAVLRPLIGGIAAVTLGLHIIVVLRVFLIADVLHGGPRAFGVLAAVLAVGMVAGSLAGGRIAGTTTRVRVAVACLGGLPVGVLLAGTAGSLTAFGIGMATVGLANGVLTVCWNALLLTRVPDEVRGRVLAAVIGTLQTCDLIGMVAAGPLGRAVGPRTVFVAAGCVGLAIFAAVLFAIRGRLAFRGTGGGPDDDRDR